MRGAALNTICFCGSEIAESHIQQLKTNFSVNICCLGVCVSGKGLGSSAPKVSANAGLTYSVFCSKGTSRFAPRKQSRMALRHVLDNALDLWKGLPQLSLKQLQRGAKFKPYDFWNSAKAFGAVYTCLNFVNSAMGTNPS